MSLTEDEVRAARLRAAEAHARVLGDQSACALTKSGISFPAGKFWEGATAALTELLRSGAADLDAEARRLVDVWTARRVPGSQREADAYRAGGLEALAGIVA